MHGQLSTSRFCDCSSGMGDQSGCYRCGKEGHWSKECPVDCSGAAGGLLPSRKRGERCAHLIPWATWGIHGMVSMQIWSTWLLRLLRVRSWGSGSSSSSFCLQLCRADHVSSVRSPEHSCDQSPQLHFRWSLLQIHCCQTQARLPPQLLWLLPLPPLPPITKRDRRALRPWVQLYSPQLERATVMGQRVSCLRLQQLHGILCMTWPGMNGSSMWPEHSGSRETGGESGGGFG